MLHKKSETRSLITFKKEELFDQLLNSVEGGPTDPKRVVWISIETYSQVPNPEPSEREIDALTRPFRSQGVCRVIRPSFCREWAIGHWREIISDGRKTLIKYFKEKNDTQFLEAVERVERPAKNAWASKGK